MLIVAIILFLFVFGALGFKKPAVALLTAPVVCFMLVLGGVWGAADELVIFAPVLFLVTLVAVLLPRRGAEPTQWPQQAAKWILLSIVALLLVAVAFALFGHGGILGLVFVILLIGTIISFALTSRHELAAYIISTIGSSMRQNLPLPMALESAASGQTDKRARILRGIRKWLVQGYSLSDSVKRGYPKCPGYAVAMISAAERIDQLPLAVGSIEADMVSRADETKQIRPIHPGYFIILMMVLFFIVLGLATFVLPKFHEVIQDMTEGELPAATWVLLSIVEIVIYKTGPALWIILAFIVLVVVPVSIQIKFRPRRPHKPYLLSRITDYIRWHLPIIYWFENNYSTTQAVELLRLSLNAGCTVNEAIANTLDLDVNNCFKKRLKRWLERVEAGENIAASARQARVGEAVAWAFDEKVNRGNTLTILETLESFYRSNYSYRVNLARFIMYPCLTLVMGAVVGFVVYAMFSPGVAVVHYLADSMLP
jgi:type II secretory pathway component PulF